MGCYAALPALGAAADFVTARRRPSVLLCVELTSLHVQPPPDGPLDLQQVVAHALFADAAAAVVVEPQGPGLQLVDAVALTDVSTADHMTWDVTDLGFVMGLSPQVPDVLARSVGPVVAELLGRNGLTVDDVPHWAVHPGGRRIVEVVAEALGLRDDQAAPSYAVLDEAGNCSSATVLLVLERLAPGPGEHVVAMAFGPGLTLCATLLQAC
jgi:predicted naringenin-chalcone synthase